MLIATFLTSIAFSGVFYVAIDPTLRNDLIQRYIRPTGFYVKLPEKSIIKDRLYAANFGDLVEKTNLDAKLEKKEIYYRDVESKIGEYLYQHHLLRYQGGERKTCILDNRSTTRDTQRITEILLADHPTLIEKIRAEKTKSSEYLIIMVQQLGT